MRRCTTKTYPKTKTRFRVYFACLLCTSTHGMASRNREFAKDRDALSDSVSINPRNDDACLLIAKKQTFGVLVL